MKQPITRYEQVKRGTMMVPEVDKSRNFHKLLESLSMTNNNILQWTLHSSYAQLVLKTVRVIGLRVVKSERTKRIVRLKERFD